MAIRDYLAEEAAFAEETRKLVERERSRTLAAQAQRAFKPGRDRDRVTAKSIASGEPSVYQLFHYADFTPEEIGKTAAYLAFSAAARGENIGIEIVGAEAVVGGRGPKSTRVKVMARDLAAG